MEHKVSGRNMTVIIILLVAVTVGMVIFIRKIGTGKAVAVSAVEAFHRDFNDARYEKLYSQCTSRLRSRTTMSAFIDSLKQERALLGRTQDTRVEKWQVSRMPGGTIVMMETTTRFESGAGQEIFRFELAGGNAQIDNYSWRTTNR